MSDNPRPAWYWRNWYSCPLPCALVAASAVVSIIFYALLWGSLPQVRADQVLGTNALTSCIGEEGPDCETRAARCNEGSTDPRCKGDPPLDFIAAEIAARVFWGITAKGFALCLLAAALIALYTIGDALRDLVRNWFSVTIAVLIAAGFASLINEKFVTSTGSDSAQDSKRCSPVAPGYYGNVAASLWVELCEQEHALGLKPSAMKGGSLGIGNLTQLWSRKAEFTAATAIPAAVDSINVLAAFAVILLAAAGSLVLRVPSKALEEAPSIHIVLNQHRRLLRLLYAGSLALAIGAVQTYALFRLPAPLLTLPVGTDVGQSVETRSQEETPGEGVAPAAAAEPESPSSGRSVSTDARDEALSHTALFVATINGAVFSLLVLAMYIPAAMIISARVRDVMSEAIGGDASAEERKNWLGHFGLSTSVWRQLGRLTAGVAPLLVSPLADILGTFASYVA